MRPILFRVLNILTIFALVVSGSTASAAPPSGSVPPSLVNKAFFASIPNAEDGGSFVAISPELVRRFALTLTGREVLQAMDQGLLTSREYVDILIERIEAYPELNAIISFDPEAVRAAADAADVMRADGDSLGALHGLPILVKDAFFTEDFATTAGTPALADFRPGVNAATVQAMLDQGAILLGKTNTHELQSGYTTNNPFTGTTRNPYDFDRIPGGSSGGNSAALAARLAPLALGGDTAGSTRVPAALTGTFGFRPTTGRYSTDGVVPLAATFDTPGPMARDVRDLALVDAILAGEAQTLDDVAVSALRIGVPSALLRENLAFPVEWHFQRALRRLERAGATLVEADLPGISVETVLAFNAVLGYEAPRNLGAFLAANGIGVSLEELVGAIATPSLQAAFIDAAANPVPEEVYEDVVNNVIPALRAGYQQYLDANGLDIVIYPTVPVPALEIGEEPIAEVGGVEVDVTALYLRNAHVAPLLGAPTVTLPFGQQLDQVPAGGLEVMGAPGADRSTLAAAHAIASILPRIRAPREIRPFPFQM